MFHIISAFAEFEHNIRHERQMDGVKSALAKGIRFGRPKKTTPEMVKQIYLDKEQGMTVTQIEKKYNISMATIFRVLRDYREQKGNVRGK